MRFKDKLKWELHLLNYKMKDFSVSKYIKEMIEFHKEYNKYGKEFNMLFDEISRYELEMLPEVNKLKSIGHEHFAKVELEDKILNIIDQDEGILTYQGEQLYNLGMICAKAGLDKVVYRALEDPKAPLQQDVFGLNIGMFCARYGLEDCAIKALENPEASIQQTTLGRYNIGMMCAQEKLERATLKAVENKQAIIQRESSYGKTIGLMCIDSKLSEAVEKLFELYPPIVFQKDNYGIGFASSCCSKDVWIKGMNIQESYHYDESVYNEFEEMVKNEANQSLLTDNKDNEIEKEV